MARLLAVDTATDACSVALHVDGDTRERHEPGPRTHLQHLLEMVRSLLADAGLRLAELDALAFGQGPGSFTGLRICAATVQGLAFGAELPAVAVSSLQALALGALRRQRDAGSVAAALDARMGEVYWALYRRDRRRARAHRPTSACAAPRRCAGRRTGSTRRAASAPATAGGSRTPFKPCRMRASLRSTPAPRCMPARWPSWPWSNGPPARRSTPPGCSRSTCAAPTPGPNAPAAHHPDGLAAGPGAGLGAGADRIPADLPARRIWC